ARGFTLIEIMVVMAIVAVASAGAMLALRDTAQNQMDREAVRIAALLEGARAQSRATGVPVVWRGSAAGFEFAGLPEVKDKNQPGSADAFPREWLTPVQIGASGRLDALRHDGQAALVLGPEPMLPPQKLTLSLPERPDIQRTIASDGVRPFAVLDGTAP
ncbi:MAG: type II secretion system protein, partial [Brachymonas sp.]|nr:type II secretion system protein [Brachymonas sp.]